MRKISLFKNKKKKIKIFSKGAMGKLISFVLRHSVEEYFDRYNDYIYVKDGYDFSKKMSIVTLCTNITAEEYLEMKMEEQDRLFSKIKYEILLEISIKYNKRMVEKKKIIN